MRARFIFLQLTLMCKNDKRQIKSRLEGNTDFYTTLALCYIQPILLKIHNIFLVVSDICPNHPKVFPLHTWGMISAHFSIKSSFNQSGYRGLDAVSQIGVVPTRMIWARGCVGLWTSDQSSWKYSRGEYLSGWTDSSCLAKSFWSAGN